MFNCYNSGPVNANYAYGGCSGGICGRLVRGCTVSNCYNVGEVSGYNAYLGGIVGLSYGTVSSSKTLPNKVTNKNDNSKISNASWDDSTLTASSILTALNRNITVDNDKPWKAGTTWPVLRWE